MKSTLTGYHTIMQTTDFMFSLSYLTHIAVKHRLELPARFSSSSSTATAADTRAQICHTAANRQKESNSALLRSKYFYVESVVSRRSYVELLADVTSLKRAGKGRRDAAV